MMNRLCIDGKVTRFISKTVKLDLKSVNSGVRIRNLKELGCEDERAVQEESWKCFPLISIEQPSPSASHCTQCFFVLMIMVTSNGTL